jgi:uncharacterized protein YecE (DUF72 family)
MQNFHLGTIGWSYNFWKGKFYPSKTAPKDYLAYYASQFNTVEVDSTFYRIPTQPTVTNWKQQTPDDFRFSLKFPQMITHVKMLRDCQYETGVFLDRVSLLGEKLGVLLLQFPPNFGIDHLDDLEAFVQELPRQHRDVVEVRNKVWLKKEFYSLLMANRVALAWADSPLMVPISEITSDFLYVRWEGDRKKVNGTLGKIEANRAEDLKLEADKIKPFLGKMEVFSYFGKYYSGYPPSDIANLQANLNAP